MSTYTIEANGTPMGEYTGDTATNLQAAYEAAVEKFGQEIADQAAAVGIEAFNTNALAGASVRKCEAEQLAAFEAELMTKVETETLTNVQLIRAYIDAEWADYKADDCTIDRIDTVEQIAHRGYADVVQVGDYAIDTGDNAFREIVRIVDGRLVSVWTSF